MRFTRGESVRWLVLSLVLLGVAVFTTVRVPHTDSVTRGVVVAFGGKLDGSACYLTARYVVDSTTYHVNSSHDDRWCWYRHDDAIGVFYDSNDPAKATLTPRGSLQQGFFWAGALAFLVSFLVFRSARRGLQDQRAPEPVA